MHSPYVRSTIPYPRAADFLFPVFDVVVICTTAPASASATQPPITTQLPGSGPAPYTTQMFSAVTGRLSNLRPDNASAPTIIVHDPASAVPIPATYFATDNAPSAPGTAMITSSSVGGSPPMTRHTRCTASDASAAPINPMPTKYAATINTEPMTPPTTAASTSAPV